MNVKSVLRSERSDFSQILSEEARSLKASLLRRCTWKLRTSGKVVGSSYCYWATGLCGATNSSLIVINIININRQHKNNNKILIWEFMYRDTKKLEFEIYDNAGNNWSQRTVREGLKENSEAPPGTHSIDAAQKTATLGTSHTGCFTTLGHNCRRWFPRSLWSKKFI